MMFLDVPYQHYAFPCVQLKASHRANRERKPQGPMHFKIHAIKSAGYHLLLHQFMLKRRHTNTTTKTRVTNGNPNQAVPLVEFMPLVFTRMPGESYQRWLGSLLCLCDFFRGLINSLACWSSTSTLGLVLFQIYAQKMLERKKEIKRGRQLFQHDPPKQCRIQLWITIETYYLATQKRQKTLVLCWKTTTNNWREKERVCFQRPHGNI